jgi:hypothetical protein
MPQTNRAARTVDLGESEEVCFCERLQGAGGLVVWVTYQDIDILAQRAVGVRFDDFLQRAARVQCLWHFRSWGWGLRRCFVRVRR